VLTKAMQCVSIVILSLAVLQQPTANFQVLLGMFICVTAILVATQAVRLDKYFGAVGFGVIALLFNPVVPVALSRRTLLWLDWVCLMPFLVSLTAFKRQPTLSAPSVMNTHQEATQSKRQLCDAGPAR